MSNPWLIAIGSGVVSPIILGVITGIVKFTKEEGLIIKFFNGVTEQKLNETKKEILERLPYQDFVTQNELDNTKTEILARLPSQDFVTQDELDNTKTEILASLPYQDFVTPESLNSAIETKLSAFASSQDSIGIKSDSILFKEPFKGDGCKVPDVFHMDKNAPQYREEKIYFNQDESQYFKEKPNIILGISLLDSEHNAISANLRIKAEISGENEKYFVLKVQTWETSYIRQVEVNWLAYGIKK